MASMARRSRALLGRARNDNPKSEFYLTDAVGIARAPGHRAIAIEGQEAEFGINSQAQLAEAEAMLQQRLRGAAMAAGVTMTEPETVWLSADTELAADVTIGPNVRFGPGVTVAADAQIMPFCDIEGAGSRRARGSGRSPGIRPGAEIGEDAHVGNFVELKTTRHRGAAPRPIICAISAMPESAPGATSAPARSPATTTAIGKYRTGSAPTCSSAPTARWWRR